LTEKLKTYSDNVMALWSAA